MKYKKKTKKYINKKKHRTHKNKQSKHKQSKHKHKQSKHKHSKNKHKYGKRNHKRTFKMKGGNLKVIPFKQYGYPKGASSAREAAAIKTQNMNTLQNNLINMHGGAKNLLTVPTFPGTQVGPINANTSSVIGNKNIIKSISDATGDCYATNSCGKNIMKGGSSYSRNYLNWYDAY